MTGFTSKRLASDQRLMDSRPVEDLIISTGTVYGTSYHTVYPVGGDWRAMEEWGIQTYGQIGSVWRKDFKVLEPGSRWYMNDRRFWFRDERDLTLFLLRWS